MARKVIFPDKGVCNRTPDRVCDDAEMDDCLGLTCAPDALRPIQRPAEKFRIGEGTLLLVHEVASGKHYVYHSGSQVSWTDGGNTLGALDTGGDGVPLSATAVGNTLVLSTTTGIVYHLWKGGAYKRLGSGIPQPEATFRMLSMGLNGEMGYNVFVSDGEEMAGIIDDKVTEGVGQPVDDQACCDLIAGLYAEAEKRAFQRGLFTRPFLACCAVELYDGTYTHVTNPVLMLPSITENHMGQAYKIKNGKSSDPWLLRIRVLGFELECEQTTDYTEWRDIVRGVSVFVTPQVAIYDTSLSKPTYQEYRMDAVGSYGKSWDGIISSGFLSEYRERVGQLFPMQESGGGDNRAVRCLRSRGAAAIKKDIREASQFYKLCDLTRYDYGTGARYVISPYLSQGAFELSAKSSIPSHVIENITSQERMLNVDYHSFCPLGTDKQVYSFNRRLNLIGVRRGFFDGFSQFMPYEKSSVMENKDVGIHTYYITVEIQTDSGTVYVKKTVVTRDIIAPTWFYYPDPRARNVYINGHQYALTEHHGLNGAYYMGELPTGGEVPLDGSDVSYSSTTAWEELDNYVLQSGVDNPFVFNASGYVRVGQGEIIGLAALTTGLAQDVYSAATTLCFTTQGVWALTVDGEGQYARVSPPFSREVCDHWEGITMTDNAVFFTSEKGLMLVQGHRAQCVSGQLTGKIVEDEKGVRLYGDFLAFLRGCRMAYDYRDSLLWLVNGQYAYHWVYNIGTGTLTRLSDGAQYRSIVNDFPDTILHRSSDGAVLSLLEKPEMNADAGVYDCSLVTRPMKWGAGVALKSLRDVRHIMDVAEGKMEFSIEVSNDCLAWHALPSLMGRGFKYFKFRYKFDKVPATATFSGTIAQWQERQTHKLR